MSNSQYHRRPSQWPQPHPEAGSSTIPHQHQHQHQHPLSLPMPQSRHQGHGFDFRRPIMSTPPEENEVVDLTNEPDSPFQIPSWQPSRNGPRPPPPRRHRPPRFGRNIMEDVIDLEEEEEEPGAEGAEADNTIDLDPPSSPEVQFVRATARPAPSTTSSRLFDVLNLHARSGLISPHEVFRQEIALRTRLMGRRRPRQPTLDDLFFAGNQNENIDLTIDLDYQAPGFVIHEPQPPTPPAYEPPSPAPEGFTRTVSETDVVVCPNCDRELGLGEGPRQQIWVAKPCGHVYCGECTNNRAMSKKKGAPLSATKPFAKCKVAGCEKSLSHAKNMVQIYL